MASTKICSLVAVSVVVLVVAVSGAEIKVLLESQEQLGRQERRLDTGEVVRIQETFVEVLDEKTNKEVEEVEVEVEEVGGRGRPNRRVNKTPSSGANGKKRQRGLVPQLWKNYTGPVETPAENVTCDVAFAECKNRAGCGFALENYMFGCLSLIEGESKVCNSHCQHSLIALMSTHEGKRLMKCNCAGDEQCQRVKSNVQPCQDAVTYAIKPQTQVSCTQARWICAADAPCAKALEYYDQFCRAMFRGRKCTKRCMNSINILRRQRGADKLEQCYCDGSEDFPCREIKSNMDTLCFRDDHDDMSNDIRDGGKTKNSGSFSAKLHRFMIVVCVVLSLMFQVLFQAMQDMAVSSSLSSSDNSQAES